MLVPYNALQQLPQDTVNNLIKEYLFTQLEDGNFSHTDETELKNAIIKCHQALKSGTLVVEYSEEDESIALRHKDNITNMQPEN
ncbi:YheU family protein [Shewanella surugensis]|uniref:YheU family protein n=1 Tax=Shewanella surugensis TaxID=212020 RepID=A0ABT0LFX1_9GAMM|nr:YheU family protein [Shewanella surugensis]MCL1126560.1 YheU family protein [Shewanella surugensis]